MKRSAWPSAAERFRDATEWGPRPDFRPDLGPCLIYTGADHRYAWEQNGHPYDEGTPRGRNGARNCRTCYEKNWRKSWAKKSRAANGLPNRKIKYDQEIVRSVIRRVRSAETTIAQGAREIGCNPNYLGRRIWNETKKDVFARDGHQCQRCGAASGVVLDPHHRIARGGGGSTRPEISFGMANLVTLCRTCHDHVEANPEESFQAGWRVRHGHTPSAIPLPTCAGWVLLDDLGGRTAYIGEGK